MSTIEKRKGSKGFQQKMYFSQLSNPEEFPKVRRIWMPVFLQPLFFWVLRRLGAK